MRYTFIFFLFIPLCGLYAQHSSSREANYSLQKIKFISITLPGKIEIFNQPDNQMSHTYQVEASGRVWGLTNKEDSILFYSSIRVSGDTLILTGASKDFWAMGISTYQENVTHQIYLPTQVSLLVAASGVLIVHGQFVQMTSFNSDLTQLYANKVDLGKLKCEVQGGSLSINGIQKGSTYELEGIGVSHCTIKSHSIQIILN